MVPEHTFFLVWYSYTLKREPDCVHDTNAIQVVERKGRKRLVAYLQRTDAELLAPIMDAYPEQSFFLKVKRGAVFGTWKTGMVQGVSIGVKFEQREATIVKRLFHDAGILFVER